MADKFQHTYRIKSNRMQGYDYSAYGLYFVTICTKNRKWYFGTIVEQHNGAALQPTVIGQTTINFWNEIPKHYPFVELDVFVVMPNHIHGILFFNRPDKTDWRPNQFGVQSQNLGAVIRALKSSVKRFANRNNITFEWQSGYYDRIIRNEKELNGIRDYIVDNPTQWNLDVCNIPRGEAHNNQSHGETHNNQSHGETHNCASLRQALGREIENLLFPFE